MEAIEFYRIDKQIRYTMNGEEHVLTQSDREIVEFMLQQLRTFYPDALERLSQLCNESAANKYWYDFRRVEWFIRCNFSELDRVSFDIQNGMLQLEDVKCPLRGICHDEGKICRPKLRMPVGEEEARAAMMYASGMSDGEIASRLKKSVKTIKNQLQSVRKRLHLTSLRELIKVLRVYQITM